MNFEILSKFPTEISAGKVKISARNFWLLIVVFKGFSYWVSCRLFCKYILANIPVGTFSENGYLISNYILITLPTIFWIPNEKDYVHIKFKWSGKLYTYILLKNRTNNCIGTVGLPTIVWLGDPSNRTLFRINCKWWNILSNMKDTTTKNKANN